MAFSYTALQAQATKQGAARARGILAAKLGLTAKHNPEKGQAERKEWLLAFRETRSEMASGQKPLGQVMSGG